MIGVLLTLARGEGQVAMIYLAMEACKSRLLGQRPLSCDLCELMLIPDAIVNRTQEYSS
jgi:hypothetical protein